VVKQQNIPLLMLSKGNQSFIGTIDIFQGRTPSRVILALVANISFIGSYDTNPLYEMNYWFFLLTSSQNCWYDRIGDVDDYHHR
jgi:hypothetical protein